MVVDQWYLWTGGGRRPRRDKKLFGYEPELCHLEHSQILNVYNKRNPQKVVWSGTIDIKQMERGDEVLAYGHWVGAVQIGVDRDMWARWFFGGFPATLNIAPH